MPDERFDKDFLAVNHLRQEISMFKQACLLLTIVIFCFADSVTAQNSNWPQWRGPKLDNVSAESGLPTEFDKDTNLAYRLELPGPGGASPIVWDDHVYLTTIDDADGIHLICVDPSGSEKWRQPLKGKNKASRDKANSASPSPCTDGEHIWANSTAGYLQCFDMQGEEVWSVDLQDRYGDFKIQFGMTSTPILDQGRLYLQMIHGSMRDRSSTSEGWVVALDAKSGEEIWKHHRLTDGTLENKHSYTSPIICREGDTEYLVTHGADYAIGHSLEDGSELWRCGGLNPRDDRYNQFLRFVASPVFYDGKLIIPSAKNGPVFCLKTELEGTVEDNESSFHWKMEKGTPDVSTPACHNGLVFLTRENGSLMVLEADSGDITYSDRQFAGSHRSSPVIADDKVFVVDRTGKVLVFSLQKEPELLATNDLAEETTASPAIANGRIYIRTFEALYAFEMK